MLKKRSVLFPCFSNEEKYFLLILRFVLGSVFSGAIRVRNFLLFNLYNYG